MIAPINWAMVKGVALPDECAQKSRRPIGGLPTVIEANP